MSRSARRRFPLVLRPLEDRITPDAVTVSANAPVVVEGNAGTASLVFTVTRTGELDRIVTIDYATQGGTAVPGADYQPTSGTLRFEPGQTVGAVTVPVIGNRVDQGDRTVGLTLSNPSAAEYRYREIQSVAVGNDPRRPVQADFDGDGRTDLAVPNHGDDTVTVLLNQSSPGAPTLGAGVAFAVGNEPDGVAASDLTGDGRPDLAVTTADGVSVLVNTSAGGVLSFAPVQNFPAADAYGSIAIGDLTGDGRPDIAAFTYDSVAYTSTLVVLENTTTGGALSFAAPQVFPAVTVDDFVTEAAIVDFDGDGRPDVATIQYNGDQLAVVQNLSAGGVLAFGLPQTLAVAVINYRGDFVAADFTGDGRPDIAASNADYPGTVSVFVNTSSPGTIGFSAAQPVLVRRNSPYSVAAADVDGDGRPDLVVLNAYGGTVTVLLNTTPLGAAAVSFEELLTDSATESSSPDYLTAADLDGDGDVEIALVFSDYDRVALLSVVDRSVVTLNYTPEEFDTGTNVDVYAVAVAVADVTGDGKPDIVYANESGGYTDSVSVLVNVSSGGSLAFAPGDTIPIDGNIFGLAVADLNGDGRPDVALSVIDGFDRFVVVLRNATAAGGPPVFVPAGEFDTGAAGVVVTVDLDGDGRPDVALGGTYDATVLRNTSSGDTIGFDPALRFATEFSFISDMVAADLTGDGRPDLAMVEFYDNDYLQVLVNTSAPGTVSFAPVQLIPNVYYGYSLAAADFDGDGDMDVAVIDVNSTTVFLNTSTGGVLSLEEQPLRLFNTTFANVVAADVNGDGRPDLVLGGSDITEVHLNTTAPGGPVTFAPPLTFARGISKAVADFDGDGKVDILALRGFDDAAGDGGIVVLRNTTPTFTVTGSTGAILDDDTAGATIAPIFQTLTEGETGSFTIALTSVPTAPVTIPVSAAAGVLLSTDGVNFFPTVTLTATGMDPLTVFVRAVENAVVDPGATVAVAVGPFQSADPNYNALDPGGVTVTVLDNDVTYAIAAGTGSVAEGNAGSFVEFSFTVTRNGATGGAGSVAVGLGGTATPGSDWEFVGASGAGVTFANGVLTFDAGATSATLTFRAVGDDQLEPDETATVTLSAPTAAGTGTGSVAGPDTAATLIANDDVPPNSPPVAADDSYATPVNSRLTIVPPGVLGNDRDPDGDPLTAALLDGPAVGTLTFAADGSFQYTAAPGSSGPVSFTYTVSDGRGGTAVGRVVILVADDPPTASPLPDQTVAAARPVTLDLTAYFTDAEGPLTFEVVGNTDPDAVAASVVGGQLRLTRGFRFGRTVVTVRATDAAGQSVEGSLVASSTAVNEGDVAQFALNVGAGGPGAVTVYGPDGSPLYTVVPFSAAEAPGGVRPAVADVTGDGVPDVVVGTGPSVRARVRVVDGATRQVVAEYVPYEDTFVGGTFVAVADFDGDGRADTAVAPDFGGGPRVTVFSGADGRVLADFFGIDDPDFRGGARVGVSDVTGGGLADLVVSAGRGGGPRVAMFDGTTLRPGTDPRRPFSDFYVFEDALRDGAYVTAGDLDGDGLAELIAGGGPGGGPRVRAWSGADLLAGRGPASASQADFMAADSTGRTGVRVVAKRLDGDGRSDLLTAAENGPTTSLSVFRGAALAPGGRPPLAFGLDGLANELLGVYVG